MSLGGNDLIGIIQDSFSIRESYSVLTHTDPTFAYMKRAMSDEEVARKNEGLQNPSSSFSEMQSKIAQEEVTGVMNNYQLSGGLYNEFWETTSRISEDQIAKNVEYIVDKLLQYDSSRKIILATVNPLCAKLGWAFNSDYKEVREHPGTLTLLFDNLRSKFRKRVFPNLFKQHGLRIVLLDQYNSFKNNCTINDGKYYIEDGIHFSDDGDKEFSKGLAYFMGMLQWFPINDQYFSDFFYSDPSAFLASLAIDMKAVESYQDDPDFTFDNIIYTKLIATKRGFYKDFFPGNADNRKYIAVRDGEEEAFYVKGLVAGYFATNEGGLNGRFGFPLIDETTDGFAGTIRNSDFECGRIYFNYIGQTMNTTYQPSLASCQKKLQEESNWQ